MYFIVLFVVIVHARRKSRDVYGVPSTDPCVIYLISTLASLVRSTTCKKKGLARLS